MVEKRIIELFIATKIVNLFFKQLEIWQAAPSSSYLKKIYIQKGGSSFSRIA